MFEHVLGVGRARGLAQPDERADLAVLSQVQQGVELPPMLRRQRFGQRGVDASRGARDRLGADPFDDLDRRQQDRLATQVLDERAGQHDALVGLPREVVEVVHRGPVVPHGERPEAEDGLQLDQMLPARLVALGRTRPSVPARL